MMQRRTTTQLLILACLLALLLTLIGLRLYFSQARLDKHLSFVVLGQALTAQQGQLARRANKTSITVTANPKGQSTVVIDNLNINSHLFEAIEVLFLDKTPQQTLNLTLSYQKHLSDTISSVDNPILYMNQEGISRFELNEFIGETDSIIKTLRLSTPRLIAPYTLQSIRFVPKRFTTLQYLSLLGHDVLTLHYEVDSANYFLLPSKLLLLIYFATVTLIFAALLLYAKKPLINVCWWILVVMWLLFDGRYLYDKLQSTWFDQPTQNLPLITPPVTNKPNRPSLFNLSHPILLKEPQKWG